MPAQYVQLAGVQRYWWIAVVWSLVVAAGMYVGVSLWSRRARAPRLAIVYYVASTPALTWIAWQTAHADRYAAAATIGGACAGALVWGFYFHLSERVRNTYGPLPATAFSPLHTALVACVAGALTIAGAAVMLTTSRSPWTEYALDGAARFSVRGPGAPRRIGEELLFNDSVRAFRAAVYTRRIAIDRPLPSPARSTMC